MTYATSHEPALSCDGLVDLDLNAPAPVVDTKMDSVALKCAQQSSLFSSRLLCRDLLDDSRDRPVIWIGSAGELDEIRMFYRQPMNGDGRVIWPRGR